MKECKSEKLMWSSIFVIFLCFLGTRAQSCNLQADSDVSVGPFHYEVGTPDDCCKICYYTNQCVGYTWSSYNGGTCWLKDVAGPIQYSPGNFFGVVNRSVVVPPEPSINNCSMQMNVDIPGNDILNVPGLQSDCCNLCYVTSGCKAYTWNNLNNGTCYLKSAVGPTSSSNAMITGVLSAAKINWKLNETYDSTNFFEKFIFFTDGDPTHGYVDFVNRSAAQQLGLTQIYGNGSIYMGADHTNVINSGRGRPSVRLSSARLYNGGLFILDLIHMPVGPGTWPAYWFVGPDWPNNGEADILEGIGGNTKNAMTLHTADGCAMQTNWSQIFSGSWADGKTKGVPATDCFIQDWNQQDNEGCSIQGPNGTYGDQFNSQNGGVIAFEWEKSDFMRVWLFPRNAIPSNIQSGNPDTTTWGKPSAFFLLGTNCPPVYFNDMQLVFDLTFCGDWAGAVYQGGNGACIDEVKNHPEAYVGAYWMINYIKIYQNFLETCTEDMGTCKKGGDCCSGFCFNGVCN